MREVETFLWRVPACGPRRAYTSRVHLTHADALEQYGPAATQVPGSRRVQQVLETPEERRQVMQSAGRDGTQPPPER